VEGEEEVEERKRRVFSGSGCGGGEDEAYASMRISVFNF
jgi:hypothetical protein